MDGRERTDILALRGARVHTDDHAALEDEAQRGGAVQHLDRIGRRIAGERLAQERARLKNTKEDAMCQESYYFVWGRPRFDSKKIARP